MQLALLDGNTITTRRTVAASALAADYLARKNSSRLLVVGAGRVASLIPDAYRSVRPIAHDAGDRGRLSGANGCGRAPMST
jgi:ornithine cyclodeaminase